MTRTDVKKVAWTLRLIGYGMLFGAFALMLLSGQHTAAAPGSSASARLVK
ncbi:MAG TPA: hypothetical protein VH183_12365 [Burkholderiaceae bacterium]|nr:hypothetical protein [Burkholderiaceae bacterium]